MIELERIKKYCDEATSAPWKTVPMGVDDEHGRICENIYSYVTTQEDRENMLFIAQARTDLPRVVEALIDEVRFLKQSCLACTCETCRENKTKGAKCTCRYCIRIETIEQILKGEK